MKELRLSYGYLTLSCIMLKNGHTYFFHTYCTVNNARFLKYFGHITTLCMKEVTEY